MTSYTAAGLVTIVGALAPAMYAGVHGRAEDRLVGLQLVSAATTLVLLLLAQATSTPSMLVVPLVLVTLAPAGTFVFTRLLAPHGEQQQRPRDQQQQAGPQ